MFINPKTVIEKGFITGLYDEKKQVQPNAVDFTVDRMWQLESILGSPPFVISEASKQMRKQNEIVARTAGPNDDTKYFHLEANSEYDVMSNVYVEVPEGLAAILVLRSTFVRNGLWLASGLYDSGFKGNIGAVLHTPNMQSYVAPGTRIGQIIFVSSDSAGVYAGGYNAKDGVHWTEPTK